MATASNEPITGRIVSFGIDAYQGQYEAGSIGDVMSQVHRKLYAVIQPTDRGPEEKAYGFPLTAEVGDLYVRLTCRCKALEWVPNQPGLPRDQRGYECLACGRQRVHRAAS